MSMSSEDIVFSHPHDHFTYRHLAVVPNSCFVLMPFQRTFTKVFETIREALESLGMSCERADNPPLGKLVLERVLAGIRSAELIIVDLTGRNANVFYELGLAHTCTKNVLLLTQKSEDVPFDLQHFYWYKYSPNKPGLQALKKVVCRAADDVRAKGPPPMLKGATERTKQIVEYMERQLTSASGGRGLVVRIQAGFSSVANEGYPDAKDDETVGLGRLLEEERDCLIKLLKQGAILQAMISPPVGPWTQGRWKRRYDRLLAFLRDRQYPLDRCEFVYSVEEGPNLFFLGEDLLFEGHKTGIEGGFGWTMVYTSKPYLNARLTIFDMLFQSTRLHTLKEYGPKGTTEGDKAALREAVITAVQRAMEGKGTRWTRDRQKD